MRNLNDDVWSKAFNVEVEKNEVFKLSEDILEDSYQALNKFYQKENRRSRSPKKVRPAWQ